MKFTVNQIAAILGGTIEGDGTIELHDLSGIENGSAGTLSFLANPKYNSAIYQTGASCVLVSEDFKATAPLKATLIRVKDPYMAFTLLLEKVRAVLLDKKGIENPSFIAEDAELGIDVYVGAFSYIGKGTKIGDGVKIFPLSFIGDNCVIGKGCVIYPSATLYYGTRLGENCIIHSGAVIGSDGFGFAPEANGSLKKIPQTGIVVLEDEVEIGANATIDRATLGQTLLRKGTKIDNLVQIAHNVEIGENTVIAAQTGISGSTKIGNNAMIGGQVGIVGHIELADGIKIGAQSGVSKTVKEKNKALRGSPAQEYKKQLRDEVMQRQLGEMADKIALLEEKLKKLEGK